MPLHNFHRDGDYWHESLDHWRQSHVELERKFHEICRAALVSIANPDIGVERLKQTLKSFGYVDPVLDNDCIDKSEKRKL